MTATYDGMVELTAAAPFFQRVPQTHIKRVDERASDGKALRNRAPRKDMARWKPASTRRDPVELLIESSKGRLEELVPIRYGRMSANPFAFYRGAAAIMAHDLSCTPSTGVDIQICGDCHLLNFGGFATTERHHIFDLNDFDETSIGPWEWDLKRLTASFVIAGRSNGFASDDCRLAAEMAAASYRKRMWEYASMPVLDTWYDAIDLQQVIDSMQDKQSNRFYTKKLLSATEDSAHEKEFAKLAFEAGDPPRIKDQPPLIFHFDFMSVENNRAEVEQLLQSYTETLPPERRVVLNRFELVDIAMKVVGVGSVGTFCGIALLISGNGDPLFLQVKEARQSVLEPYTGATIFPHAGQRVVVGQRLMQAASDMFLGWLTGTREPHRQYYIRQLKDAKISPVVEVMDQSNLKNYAVLCGRALARAHARSGDAAVLAGYMGKTDTFDEAMADFSVAYADQNERDHAALVRAIHSGRVQAQSEA